MPAARQPSTTGAGGSASPGVELLFVGVFPALVEVAGSAFLNTAGNLTWIIDAPALRVIGACVCHARGPDGIGLLFGKIAVDPS